MNERITAEVMCGFFAFAGAIISAYAMWSKLRPEKLKQRYSEDHKRYRQLSALAANLPMLIGYACGVGALLVQWKNVLPGDRFYPVEYAVNLAVAPLIAGLIFLALDWILPPLPRRSVSPSMRSKSSRTIKRAVVTGILLVLTAITAAKLGVEFPLLAVGSEQVFELGDYASIASILWLMFAVLIVKLLDGLDGAASLLLLVSAGVVYYITAQSMEYFLNTYAVILIGAILGSIRFHVHPARFPLRGGGSLFMGFLFAVLTVLARQKSVTAGLVIAPLLLMAVVLGIGMMGLLERSLTVGKEEKQ